MNSRIILIVLLLFALSITLGQTKKLDPALALKISTAELQVSRILNQMNNLQRQYNILEDQLKAAQSAHRSAMDSAFKSLNLNVDEWQLDETKWEFVKKEIKK